MSTKRTSKQASKQTQAAAVKEIAPLAETPPQAETPQVEAPPQYVSIQLKSRSFRFLPSELEAEVADYRSEVSRWNAVVVKHDDTAAALQPDLSEVALSSIRKQATVMRKHSDWKPERIHRHVTRFQLIASLRALLG
jgi:hypothetical protein